MSTTLTPEQISSTRPALGGVAPAAVCAVAGALLFYVGQALLPSMPDDLDRAYAAMVEHRDRLMAARLATSAGAFLFVPAALGLARLIPQRGRGSRLLLAGAALFGIATFSNALSQAVAGYATWDATATGFDPTSGRTIVDTIESGIVALPLGFWSIPAFALGLLLMAAALIRSRWVPVWQPVLLAFGTVLAGALAGVGPLVVLTQAPFTVAFIALSLRIPRVGSTLVS